MCRSKMATRTSESYRRSPNPSPRPAKSPSLVKTPRKSKSSPIEEDLYNPFSTASFPGPGAATSSSSYRLDSSVGTTSFTSHNSLSSLRDTLPESTQIYDYSEIRTATNNFLKPHSSSSQSWRCELKGQSVFIFQRKLRKQTTTADVQKKLSVISKSHFMSIVKLRGISVSNDHIYLVYDYIPGSDLSVCLRNKVNPDFTILSTWMSRMQIATDVAAGLDYIHNTAGLSIDMVHKHIKSSGIIITEPLFKAKICHFGAAELCGDTNEDTGKNAERRVEGVTGYMSPEFKSTGIATQKSDVYAFGIVILELLTGNEPVKYRFDRKSGNYTSVSVVDTAREVIEKDGDTTEVEMRLRRWVDRRLKDSYPVDVAEKMTRVALQCVEDDPEKRPHMKWVAGKISKFYLNSKNWVVKVKLPTGISISLDVR